MSDEKQVREVEQFLYREARLLDERRFHEWLELMADDVHYWMPTRINRLADRDGETWAIERELSGSEELAFFDETRESLERRVARLDTGRAWAEDPPSRTRRLITNVEVEPGDAPHELRAFSNFLLYRSRGETKRDTFVGQRRDVLRLVKGQFKLARRMIVLDATVSPANNFSVFF